MLSHLRTPTWMLAGIVLVAGSGCGDDGSTGSPDEDSDGSSSDSGQIEMSVADALAPYDAESQVSESYLLMVAQNVQDEVLGECMESLGVPDPDLTVEPFPREQVIGGALPDFPYIERIQEQGFIPHVEEYDDHHYEFSDEEITAMEECDASNDAMAEASALMAPYYAISVDWYGILSEVDQHPEIISLRDEFSQCALDQGIPPAFAEDETTFTGATDSAHMSIADEDLLHQELYDLGQIYLRCGRDLFERKVELRLERRDDFLDEHWDDIVELSEILHGEGLIDEPVELEDA